MEKRVTPWPIELNQHPGFKKSKSEIETQINTDEELTPEKIHKIALESFNQPDRFRKMILDNVHTFPKENLSGKNVFYMWLNKTCPVGCEFCFFQSPKNAEKTKDNEITDEGLDKIIQFAKDAKLDKFVVSGGGEPMVSIEKINKLVKNIESNILVIVTSGFWAKSEQSTDKNLSRLLASSNENTNQPETFIRLSLDSGHLEKLSKDKSFGYVHNIINWFSENASKDSKFKFLIHAMEGDETVENLLSELPIDKRGDEGGYLKRITKIQLKNGLNFSIEYSQIFDSNTEVDLSDKEKSKENKKTFIDFIKYKRNGNMSLQFHENNPKGAYFLTLYDGTNMIWGATSPDSETSIYEDGYQETMKKNYDDILSLGTLEKGSCYIQEIVSEVNPTAVSRSVGMGIRDFYSRLLWEEDTTRLYGSVRIIQDYIKEERFTADDIKKWPQEIKALVSLDREELKDFYRNSPRTIVHQYLEDDKLSSNKLIALYKLVSLGHYAISKDQMVKIVKESKIDQLIKDEFLNNLNKDMHLNAYPVNELAQD